MSENKIKYEMKKVANNLLKHFGMYITKRQWDEQCKIEIDKAMIRMKPKINKEEEK